MTHIVSTVDISASPTRVWAILTDFAAYPLWNPFIRSLVGGQRPGGRLRVTAQPEGGSPMSFKPTLLVFDPERELRWKGRLGLPGLFDGEHYFELAEPAPGRVRLIHGERFSGLLVPVVFRGAMRQGIERGFNAMNQALKRRAEAGD